VTVLALAGAGALSLELPVGIALILLILTSARRTGRPSAPTRRRRVLHRRNNNLGELAGLAAAVA